MHDAENKSSHRRTQRAFVEGEADHMTPKTLPPSSASDADVNFQTPN